MKGKLPCLFWFLFLFSIAEDGITTAQVTCAAGNGQCSDQCLYRGGTADRTCGCPCLSELNADSRTCNATIDCGTDIYILADSSINVDPVDCILSSIPGTTQTWTNWASWKQILISILEFFREEEATRNVNVGVQLYSSAFNIPILANYTGMPNLQNGIDTLRGMSQPLCTGISSYVRHLGQAVENNPGFQSWIYRGPYQLRPYNATSRVAIAVNYASDNSLSDASILIWRGHIMKQFDRVIVITRSVITDATLRAANIRIAKLMACGHPTNPCPYVLYVDGLNDLGIPLSNEVLAIITKATSCIGRSNGVKAVLTTCEGNMTVTIPKCQLRGMTPSDLMLNDPACNVQDHTVEVGMNYVVNVPFGGCGMIQTVDNSTGIARSIYKQTIQTRNYNSSQFLLDVRFDLECETSTFFNATYGAIKPGAHLEQGSLARQGIFQLELAVFTSDAFSTPITGNLAYIIDTPVYVEGRSEPLSNALQLKLWSCKATPTSNINDQTSYYLISNGGCQKDPTVIFYTRASNGKVRFKFNMFEFVANNSLLAVQRGSVYLHCSFIVCTTTDTTGKCGSACHSRRRRSDDVEEQTVTKTIGPFTVESNNDDEPIQTVDESISISRGLARLNGGKSPALDDTASTEGRRIEFVVQSGSISSESVSVLINAASIFFFVFGVYFVLRYVRSQSMSRHAAEKCIKHTVYHDSNPREPEWCKQCCHDPVPAGNIQSTLNLNQPPPQYEE